MVEVRKYISSSSFCCLFLITNFPEIKKCLWKFNFSIVYRSMFCFFCFWNSLTVIWSQLDRCNRSNYILFIWKWYFDQTKKKKVLPTKKNSFLKANISKKNFNTKHLIASGNIALKIRRSEKTVWNNSV